MNKSVSLSSNTREMKYVKWAVVLLIIMGLQACSPERMVTRKIEGKWNLVSIDGVTLPQGESYQLEFDHDSRSEGEVERTVTVNSTAVTTKGIYSIMKNYSITMAFSDNPNVDTQVFDIEEYSKASLRLLLENGNHLYVFEKE